MGQEFRKLFILNGRHLPDQFMFGTQQMGRELFLSDPSMLVPTADPNLVSDSQRSQQAILIKQSAMTTPGYDTEAVEKNFLAAHHVDQIELLYPGIKKMPPGKDPKMALEELRNARETSKQENQKEIFALQLMEDRRVNDAKILQLEAQAASLVAGAQTERSAHELAVLQTQIDGTKAVNDTISKRLELMLKEQEGGEQGDGGRVAKPPGDSSVQGVPVHTPAEIAGGLGDGATV